MAEVEGSSPLSPTFETPPEHRSGGVFIRVRKLARNEEVDFETDASATIVGLSATTADFVTYTVCPSGY